jgi:hypothetical protein
MPYVTNPGGLPKKVFDDIQSQVAAHRSQFYRTRPLFSSSRQRKESET